MIHTCLWAMWKATILYRKIVTPSWRKIGYAFVLVTLWNSPLLVSCLWRWRSMTTFRALTSQVLSHGRRNLSDSVEQLRKTFRTLPEIDAHVDEQHSHGYHASLRKRALCMINAYIGLLGREAFMLQMSKRDEGRHRGTRDYYWMRDTDITACNAKPRARDVVAIVDTDYYMVMPQVLLSYDNPIIIYTMCPTKAGEENDNGMSFNFDDSGDIHVRIAGSPEFTHSLWNYGRDVITVRSRSYMRTRTYDVERKQVGSHHEVILLVPRHEWKGLYSLLTLLLDTRELARFNPVQSGWTVMQVLTEKDHSVSIAKCGSSVSVSLPLWCDQAIRAIVEVSKQPLSISTVESNATKAGVNHAQAAILCNYYRHSLPMPEAYVYPIDYSVKRYQTRSYDPEAKPSIIPFMSPIINRAISPDPTIDNERECVEERLNKIKHKTDFVLTPELLRDMEDFVKCLIPDHLVGAIVPVGEDEVYEIQNRPEQRRLLDEAQLHDSETVDRTVKAFQKKEAYGKFTAPRNISTINPKDKLEYSTIVYAMAAVIKQQPWYAFGHAPSVVASRVVTVCQNASWVLPSDFSRFDGTISNLCRYLEQMVFTRAFKPVYHSTVERLMRTQYKRNGVGVFGTWYDSGYSRLSGSPETSLNNTIVNAFVAFSAFKRMGLGARAAFDALGVYGGDDGLTADVDPEIMKNSASSLGLTITLEKIEAGSPGIKFLARLYTPEVWNGNPTSMCDLYRQLSKFHTTVSGGAFTPEVKCMEKSYAFYLTDKNTPVLGPYVTAVKRVMDNRHIVLDPEDNSSRLRTYNSLCTVDEQYPNEYNDWFMDHALSVIPHFDPVEWEKWCGSGRTFDHYLTPPCLLDPDMEIPAGIAVNGEASTVLATPGFKEKTIRRKERDDRKDLKTGDQDVGAPAGHVVGHSMPMQGNYELLPTLSLPTMDVKAPVKRSYKDAFLRNVDPPEPLVTPGLAKELGTKFSLRNSSVLVGQPVKTVVDRLENPRVGATVSASRGRRKTHRGHRGGRK